VRGTYRHGCPRGYVPLTRAARGLSQGERRSDALSAAPDGSERSEAGLNPAARAGVVGRGSWVAGSVPGLLFAGVLGVYLSLNHFIESTDTIGNELLPISILEHQTLTFNQYYVEPVAGEPALRGLAAVVPDSLPPRYAILVAPELPTESVPWWFTRVGSRVISLYPIVPGLLNTPTHLVARWLGMSLRDEIVPLARITASTIAALSTLFIYLCLVTLCDRRNTAVFFAFLFAFATAVWSGNSRSLYQHGTSVLFITAALAVLLSRRQRLIPVAGLLLGAAVFDRPTNILIAAPLALYVYRHARPALPAFLGLAAIPAAVMVWYSWVYWGSPFALGQGQGLAGFTAPEPAIAAIGLLLSPNRGLLVFSPIFVVSLGYGVYLVRRGLGHPLLRYLIWSSVAVFALYTVWGDWAGGHTYGYRFLIDAVPALILVLAVGWQHVIAPRAWARGLFMLAALASIYVHGLGAATAPCGFDDDPDNIDAHHARLWDVANAEVIRCTLLEAAALQHAHLAVPFG
jgi:hypothetical protein